MQRCAVFDDDRATSTASLATAGNVDVDAAGLRGFQNERALGDIDPFIGGSKSDCRHLVVLDFANQGKDQHLDVENLAVVGHKVVGILEHAGEAE